MRPFSNRFDGWRILKTNVIGPCHLNALSMLIA